MGNLETLQHSTFGIQHSSLLFVILATVWRRMGSGGLRGLQNRCFGAEASKGWFDSDTPPPHSGLRTKDSRLSKGSGGTQSSVLSPRFTASARPSEIRSSSPLL